MYNSFQLGRRYMNYWFNASNSKGHGIHSPFVFEFITKVMNDKTKYACYENIEALRRKMLANETVITIEDYGAGSRTNATKLRSVQSIAAAALKPKKFSQLLYRITKFYKCQAVLELGTSLGITSAYFAQAASKVFTLEGSTAIASIAKENFSRAGFANIEQVLGNFDEILPSLLSKINSPDLVYVDGNHRYEPTVRYFNWLYPHLHEYSIVVFDDIHWSAEMEQAWHEIIADERVTLSIDLFFIGIVFFRKEFLVKQDFQVRF